MPGKIFRDDFVCLAPQFFIYGFAGLLDRRGRKGGRAPIIDKDSLEKIKDFVEEDTGLEELRQRIKKELGVTVKMHQTTRLFKRLGIHRKRGRIKRDKISKDEGSPIDHAGVYFLKGAESDMGGVEAIGNTNYRN